MNIITTPMGKVYCGLLQGIAQNHNTTGPDRVQQNIAKMMIASAEC
jgi:hypothetical protein